MAGNYERKIIRLEEITRCPECGELFTKRIQIGGEAHLAEWEKHHPVLLNIPHKTTYKFLLGCDDLHVWLVTTENHCHWVTDLEPIKLTKDSSWHEFFNA